MKIAKVKPFGVFKVSDAVIKTAENNSHPIESPSKTIKKIIKNTKENGSNHFIGILPNQKELFSFIPIIENEEFFAAQFPDPIQLYFSLAFANFQFANQTRDNIVLQKGQKNPLNFVNSYLYNWHLKYKISTIIFLHSTIEAYINYIMPDDFIFRQEYEGKQSDKFLEQTKNYSKEQTERYILFKEKLKNVIPQLTGINFQNSHKRIYDKLLNLNTLRNDIIHLRSTKTKNQKHFHKVFDQVINIDLTPFVDAVKDFVNQINPDFIEFEENDLDNGEEIEFKFESYGAFGVDISVFLKILDVPQKKVILIIPQSPDKDFQNIINWAMQNLDVMAKQQLIYFPKVETTKENIVKIEILKTDKRLGWDTSENQ